VILSQTVEKSKLYPECTNNMTNERTLPEKGAFFVEGGVGKSA
jgi:hypothetical protein